MTTFHGTITTIATEMLDISTTSNPDAFVPGRTFVTATAGRSRVAWEWKEHAPPTSGQRVTVTIKLEDTPA